VTISTKTYLTGNSSRGLTTAVDNHATSAATDANAVLLQASFESQAMSGSTEQCKAQSKNDESSLHNCKRFFEFEFCF